MHKSKGSSKRGRASSGEETDVKAASDAIKQVAKTTNRALDAARGVGQFLERIFGQIAEDSVGLAADTIRGYRLRRLADLQKKTDEYLAAKGVTATQPIAPRLAYKLLDEATLEDDPDLSAKFARLLAEALDPKGEKITRQHSDVLSVLSSEAIVLLDYCWKNRNRVGHVVGGSSVSYQEVKGLAHRSLAEVQYAAGVSEDTVRHAVSLGLFKSAGDDYRVFARNRDGMGDVRLNEPFERVTIYGDVSAFEFTEFGLSFCRAVIAPLNDENA